MCPSRVGSSVLPGSAAPADAAARLDGRTVQMTICFKRPSLLPALAVGSGAAVWGQVVGKRRLQARAAPGVDRGGHGGIERDADFIIGAVGVGDVAIPAKTDRRDQCDDDDEDQANQHFHTLFLASKRRPLAALSPKQKRLYRTSRERRLRRRQAGARPIGDEMLGIAGEAPHLAHC